MEKLTTNTHIHQQIHNLPNDMNAETLNSCSPTGLSATPPTTLASLSSTITTNLNSHSVSSSIPPLRRLQKSLTEQSTSCKNSGGTFGGIAGGSLDSTLEIKPNFRKSHTCGSLFAKCNCSTPPPCLQNPIDDNNKTTNRWFISTSNDNGDDCVDSYRYIVNNDDAKQHNGNNRNDTRAVAGSRINGQSTDKSYTEEFMSTSSYTSVDKYLNNNDKKHKKLFQAYSHPDTAFIFTDENKNPSQKNQQHHQFIRNGSTIITKSGKVEIKHPQRLSSPNIGNYTILDVAVHPEILVKVSTKSSKTEKQDASDTIRKHSTPKNINRRPVLRRSQREYRSSDSENSIEIIADIEHSLTLEKDFPNTLPLSTSSSSSSRYQSLDDEGDSVENNISKQFLNNVNTTKNLEYLKYNAISHQQLVNNISINNKIELKSAQKFFQESENLGHIPTNDLIRKTSEVIQEANSVEQFRKNSKLLKEKTGNDCGECSAIIIPNEIMEANNLIIGNLKIMDNNDKLQKLESEMKHLKDVIRSRDIEIHKLKREIHKLKSVLQQTTHHMPIADGDLLSSLQTYHGMAGQQCQLTSCPNNTLINRSNNNQQDQSNQNCQGTDASNISNDIGISISAADTLNWNYKQNSLSSSTASSSGYSDDNNSNNNNNFTKPMAPHAYKKQGVSGESSDSSSQQSNNVPIPKFEKDFRSKQLIKDAIMDNDFLKNIDSTQVRELVESMYSLEVGKEEYVIREGEAGAHLYVSAEGEFEVVKNSKVLGMMGPGKAFGELAILYNCTRTASIRVLSDARVWVLDRRVFQQIMMRTGMQRIEENVNFLRSVPLLKNLTNEVLTKIADVLEVEFYTAGTYIIRQGASGDSFFLISQGTVKVTQRFGTNSEEKEIRTLGRGDYFGEQALINEDKRTANIIALAPGVECLTLDRESFSHLIGDLCELKEKNYGDENRVLAMKFAETTRELFGANIKQELIDVNLSDLEIVATLGIGGFGRVELVKCERQNRIETYALKCLKKKHIIDTRQEEHVFSERTIMLSCKTPFICRLYRTFRDNKYVYMLLESCMGGEVWTILRDRGCFDERTTQFIIGCVLQAFEYLHSRGIIYRDLKPENLMLDERGYVKLVDFGFAKYIGQSSKTWTFCGTPEYVAPEIILNKGHDRAVDYWALGILIHELLNGTPPFTANDPMKTYNIILKGIDMVDFPKHMSRSAVMLIKRLCRDVPAERLGYQKGGIQDIKKHKWFQGFDWHGLSNLTLIPPFLRPVSHALDTSYFDKFPTDTEVPPDEMSGWDEEF